MSFEPEPPPESADDAAEDAGAGASEPPAELGAALELELLLPPPPQAAKAKSPTTATAAGPTFLRNILILSMDVPAARSCCKWLDGPGHLPRCLTFITSPRNRLERRVSLRLGGQSLV